MPAVDHVDLAMSSLKRSLQFYRGLLRPLGWRWERRVAGERGETIHYLLSLGGSSTVGLRQAQSEPPGAYDRYAPGLHHLAFAVRSRGRVDERARWLLAQNSAVESGPAEHAYTPGYYAVFFADPDGLKLELVHRPALRTLRWALHPATTPFRRG